MKVQDGEKNIEVWFVRLVAICSMLSVWKVRIGGMDLLPVLLFVLVLFWMAFLIGLFIDLSILSSYSGFYFLPTTK